MLRHVGYLHLRGREHVHEVPRIRSQPERPQLPPERDVHGVGLVAEAAAKFESRAT